jgi:hypothetical protein
VFAESDVATEETDWAELLWQLQQRPPAREDTFSISHEARDLAPPARKPLKPLMTERALPPEIWGGRRRNAWAGSARLYRAVCPDESPTAAVGRVVAARNQA